MPLIYIWHLQSAISISWALQSPPAEPKLLSGYRLSMVFTSGKRELDVPKCWGRTKTSWWILEGRVKKAAVSVNHRLWVPKREWACLDSSVAVWLSKSHSTRTVLLIPFPQRFPCALIENVRVAHWGRTHYSIRQRVSKIDYTLLRQKERL